MLKLQKSSSRINLALVGENISQSRSPAIYEKLIGERLESYDLLDIGERDKIPPLEDLLEKYHGVSVTAPYKSLDNWDDTIQLRDIPESISCINTLKREKNQHVATNTDLLALRHIFSKNFVEESFFFYILGDGSMCEVTTFLLEEKSRPYAVLSRKKGNLDEKVIIPPVKDHKTVIINTCLKEFRFRGVIPKGSLFLNYNYEDSETESFIRGLDSNYQDGLELLELQAKFAIQFWFPS